MPLFMGFKELTSDQISSLLSNILLWTGLVKQSLILEILKKIHSYLGIGIVLFPLGYLAS